MKLLAIILLTALYSIGAQAEIYRWTDESGTVIYSDNPQKGAEEVHLPGLSSYSSPAIKASGDSTVDDNKADSQKYTSLKINNPVNDATIRDNTGRVEVNIDVTPALKEGHLIVFDLDGQIFKSDGLNYAFTNVDRGTHTLKAYVTGPNGQTLSAVASTQFHMKKTSVIKQAK